MHLPARIQTFTASVVVLLTLAAQALPEQTAKASEGPQASAILHMLQKQEGDWNRGDLNAFAMGYKNSPDILFIGSTIHRGYAEMLASYRKSFPTREAMGTLTFTQLEVQPLDASFATVTGHFHLERRTTGGGHYLLVVEKTSSGWKIVRDDTTNDASQR